MYAIAPAVQVSIEVRRADGLLLEERHLDDDTATDIWIGWFSQFLHPASGVVYSPDFTGTTTYSGFAARETETFTVGTFTSSIIVGGPDNGKGQVVADLRCNILSP